MLEDVGTHFFNQPRYLHLLEVIPAAETGEQVVQTVRSFADHHLGKGVVIAKDSPGFIGSHVALYGMMLGVSGRLTERLLGALAAAPGAQPFVGPNQAALEQMLKQMAGVAG